VTARVPVLYIGGTGRSGSTVLAQQLAQLKGAISVGELRYLWSRGLGANQLCGCGAPFRDCAFWGDVLSRAYGPALADRAVQAARAGSVDRIRHIPALSTRWLRPPRSRRAVNAYAELMLPLYRAILAVSAGSVIVDSSKDPSYAFALRSVSGLDVRLVHLVRDSRAVAHSWTRAKLRPEIHWQREYMRVLPPKISAALWLEYNLLFEAFRFLPSPAIRIRYEDFARDPGAVIERIVGLLGGTLLTTGRAATPFVHSISGNPIRFQKTPAPVLVDDEWRSRMTLADRRLVTAMTAPLLGAYRYRVLSGSG